MSDTFDLIVIGAGPGGYTAAIRGAQLGLNVACVEKEARLGGTCLRVGCIPSKALLEASERYHEAKSKLSDYGVKVSGVKLDLGTMQKRKEDIVDTLTKGIAGLFKKHKIVSVQGTAEITKSGVVQVMPEEGKTRVLKAPRILIATGSVVSSLPGIDIDGVYVGDSTHALSYKKVPGHLVVIGAGVIGLELGSVWNRLGSKVTVVEYLDRILPGVDGGIAKEALRIFKKQGLGFHLGSKVVAAKRAPVKKGTKPAGCIVDIEGQEAISCDKVLMAVGRRPLTHGLGLDNPNVGVKRDKRGCIEVDQKFETSVSGIFAIGDVIPGPMLAHKAEEDAVACVEKMVTGYGHVDYALVPGVVYTDPEIAGVGQTEEELKKAGVPYKVGSFPFMANGRARALGSTLGKAKILAHATTDRVLGVHIIGPRAGALIAEAGAAMTFGASAEDIARTCHAHPTLSEVIKEAALAVDGRALNI